MSPRELHLAAGFNRGEPVSKSGMGRVGGSPVDGVHLLLVLFDGHIDEEAWAGEACAAPDDVRSGSSVPSRGFRDDSITLIGICEIGADIVESLLVRVCRIGLDDG